MPISTRFGKTVEKVALLPEPEQDIIADIISREIESESGWEKSFAKSSSALEKLGKEALEDYKAGRTIPLDTDKL